MRVTAQSILLAICLAGDFLSPARLQASEPRLSVIVNPSRADKLTPSNVRAIYLKQRLFWDDGKAVVPINHEAGSRARELFSARIFGQDSRQLATYWNQRYFEAGEFPPATLASDEAVIRFVATNPNAIGYVTSQDVGESVSVVLALE